LLVSPLEASRPRASLEAELEAIPEPRPLPAFRDFSAKQGHRFCHPATTAAESIAAFL
jgi:hypothetical protein